MAETKLPSADYTAMNDIDQTSETETDFRRTIETAEQDSPGTVYYPDWSKWWGYYKDVPELQAVINKKATWAIGKGYIADDRTKKVLDKIRGNGKDTFNTIMWNLVVTMAINGDAFAEIIRDKAKRLINLKPIGPGTLGIVSNKKGIITGYTQATVTGEFQKGGKTKMDFKLKDIFHLSWKRVGDEPHGRSTIEKLQWIIDAKNESLKDIRIIFHRYVKPLIISKLASDDPDEIAAYKRKLDTAVKNMENLIVPQDTVEMERMSIPQYSTLNPLPWLEMLQGYFIIAEGVPEVILGSGRETTEASAKILYLAWQQNVEDTQQYLEEQVKAQLGLEVEFNFPADIAPEVTEDVRKARDINNFDKEDKDRRVKL